MVVLYGMPPFTVQYALMFDDCYYYCINIWEVECIESHNIQ